MDYGDIDVTTATDNSVNSVYAQLAEDVGPGKVKQTAIDLGIPKSTPDLHASPSIALGPATASVLDMTEAYATLANHGEHGRYSLVEEVTKDGARIKLPARESRQAIPRSAADATTSILQSVVDGGTGTAAQGAERPAAGKTGTAEEDKAAWFAGYTPDLATVVAVMGQDSNTGVQKSLYGATGLERINGGGYPAEIWAQYTAGALDGKEPAEFDLRLDDGADAPDGSETQQPPSSPPPVVTTPRPARRRTPRSPRRRPTPRRPCRRTSRRSPPRRRTSPPAARRPSPARAVPAGPATRGATRAARSGRRAAEAPKGRGAASMCGSAAWARPATTAPRTIDGRSGHFLGRLYRYSPVESCAPSSRSAATACRSRSRIRTYATPRTSTSARSSGS
ncbi:hypothetical protein SVIO_046430 [Streptomyces violaceusniger]|uniref:Penicillin-binding protein transpeptidase domain-containing protein n=1 Tax=Streptomyces violaceusniger TaxID=68280 RepID=A0A4D4L4U8_STRVO|nr:hypothetical protein SVIO_046430 [Streptomyces violaceusniger]